MTDEQNKLMDAAKRLSLQDQLTLGGSALGFVLGFFHWYSIRVLDTSSGISGFGPWHGKVFFLASLATSLLIAVPTLREQILGKLAPPAQALVMLGLAGAALIFGPIFFLLQVDEAPEVIIESFASIGKTIWYYLAFLATAAAVLGAAWKWRLLNETA